MNNKIVLIQSHCNTEEKIKCLKNNIEKLKNFDVDVLLFSHIPLEKDVVSLVDYFVYDSSNPTLYEERQHYYWWANEEIKLETYVPDYGWAVFNQIIKSYDVVSKENYKYFYAMCYDTIIDETVENFLTSPRNGVFTHMKPDDVDDVGIIRPEIFDTALIFFVLESDKMKMIVDSLSKEEYIKNYGWIAEKYFEEKLKQLDMYIHSGMSVKDSISESTDIFNLSLNPSYSLFVASDDKVRLRLIKHTDEDLRVIINEDIHIVKDRVLVLEKHVDRVDTFGCLINDVYENWLHVYKQKRRNKITIGK